MDSHRTRLLHAQWFFFDLDDTLHSFRAASSAATTATLGLILDQLPTPNLTLAELQTSYSRILRFETQAAFIDGKTSHQYREDRFRKLLEDCGIGATNTAVEALLECYEESLTTHLELKPHALSLFQFLKTRGKHIAVITEGPQDAQERTIAAFGLTPFVGYLATTNKFGVAKTGGLFHRVLQDLKIEAQEVVMVCDSWERDMMPALAAGLGCFWYDEKIGEKEETKGALKIQSLREIQDLFGEIAT